MSEFAHIQRLIAAEEAKQDALSKAAPKLYRALDLLVTRLKLHFLREQFPGWGGSLIEDAEAALAEARGEQVHSDPLPKQVGR